LSEEGVAGALSHLAFLDLDFLAAGCKREEESDLVGDAEAGRRRAIVFCPLALENSDLSFEPSNILLCGVMLVFEILQFVHIVFGGTTTGGRYIGKNGECSSQHALVY
jgi:hypothetical protein